MTGELASPAAPAAPACRAPVSSARSLVAAAHRPGRPAPAPPRRAGVPRRAARPGSKIAHSRLCAASSPVTSPSRWNSASAARAVGSSARPAPCSRASCASPTLAQARTVGSASAVRGSSSSRRSHCRPGTSRPAEPPPARQRGGQAQRGVRVVAAPRRPAPPTGRRPRRRAGRPPRCSSAPIRSGAIRPASSAKTCGVPAAGRRPARRRRRPARRRSPGPRRAAGTGTGRCRAR